MIIDRLVYESVSSVYFVLCHYDKFLDSIETNYVISNDSLLAMSQPEVDHRKRRRGPA